MTMPTLTRTGGAVIAAALLIGCNNLQPEQSESSTGPERQTTAATPAPASTAPARPATPTATPAAARESADTAEAIRVLQAEFTHRDGTKALMEFTEPRLLRFESTELTLTSDGEVALAVFPDMRAYAVFDAPRPYTFDALADLSPVLEPAFAAYSGKPIPRSASNPPDGWKVLAAEPAANRFSTQPPQFHRDITSQIARPVGEYAARRLEGQPAPYFEVQDLDGRPLTKSDFEGKAMLIDFWATWCPPCIESMPKLDALDRHYGNRGLVVLGMNMDEGASATRTARQFVANYGIGFQQAQGGAAATDFRVEVLPTLFLLDREHNIQAVYIGLPPDEATLRREVEMALR